MLTEGNVSKHSDIKPVTGNAALMDGDHLNNSQTHEITSMPTKGKLQATRKGKHIDIISEDGIILQKTGKRKKMGKWTKPASQAIVTTIPITTRMSSSPTTTTTTTKNIAVQGDSHIKE